MSTPAIYPADKGDSADSGLAGDNQLLKRIRERFRYMTKRWEKIRKAAEKDMQAQYGEKGPWDSAEVDIRKAAKRPCIHLDQLRQYPRALVNQVRQNPQGVKINPAGNGATEKTAELRANRWRAIEYESNAAQAYLTALQCAAERGYGVVTMETEEITWDGWDQRIKIVREPDPDAVLWDPDCKEADCSDMQDAFKLWRVPLKDFERDWPEAEVTGWSLENSSIAPEWIDKETVQVARYSYFEKTERYLYLLDDSSQAGKKVFKDELPAGYTIKDGMVSYPDGGQMRILKEKKAIEKRVKQCITNGIEILDKTEWAGRWIPVFPLLGAEVHIRTNGRPEMILESYVRGAIDGQRGFDAAKTNEVESANMVPKATYMMYEGQEDTGTDWENINKIPTPYALIKPVVDGATGAVLPLPQRVDWNPQIQEMEVMAESYRRAIQAAIGSHGFTVMDDTNVKSGKAVNLLNQQSDVGSYHFIDNYKTMIRHIGRAGDDLLDKIEDTPRDVGIRKEDGTPQVLRINEAIQQNGQSVEHRYTPRGPDGQPMVDARHDVVVDTGKSYESQRVEATDVVQSLLNGPLAPRIADLAIKWLNLGTYGDQMAKRVQPADTLQQDGMPDLPPQVKSILMQTKQQNQQLTDTVQRLLAERESKQQDLNAKAQIEQEKIASNERIEALKASLEKFKIEAGVKIAEINAATKGLVAHEQLTSEENLAQAQMDAERQIAELAHEQELQQQDQGHQQDMMQQSHTADLASAQSSQEHDQVMQQQDQMAQATMAQQQAAAAAEPKTGE